MTVFVADFTDVATVSGGLTSAVTAAVERCSIFCMEVVGVRGEGCVALVTAVVIVLDGTLILSIFFWFF